MGKQAPARALLLGLSDAPGTPLLLPHQVEKYRPKTLDDVAAHKGTIDTSKACPLLALLLQKCHRSTGG